MSTKLKTMAIYNINPFIRYLPHAVWSLLDFEPAGQLTHRDASSPVTVLILLPEHGTHLSRLPQFRAQLLSDTLTLYLPGPHTKDKRNDP